MSNLPLLTLVIPLYNEEESLPHLKTAIDAVLDRENIETEFVFINDGSTDSSASIIDSFVQSDSRVFVHHFRRNRGKSAALDQGFAMVHGKYTITMDADLQDDPEEIPRLISKLEEGYDLVSGWKKKRNDPLDKTLPSKIFNFVARKLSGVKLHDFNCGLKIYRSEVLSTIRVYGELHRFIPILAAAQGWRIGELVVNHHARRWGVTKFGMKRFLTGFFDMLTVTFLTRYAVSPMHLFGGFGLATTIVGVGILAYLSIGWFMGQPIGPRPLFFLGILMMIVGVQSFSIGLIGEMITHMLHSSKRSESEEE